MSNTFDLAFDVLSTSLVAGGQQVEVNLSGTQDDLSSLARIDFPIRHDALEAPVGAFRQG